MEELVSANMTDICNHVKPVAVPLMVRIMHANQLAPVVVAAVYVRLMDIQTSQVAMPNETNDWMGVLHLLVCPYIQKKINQ